MKRRNRFWMVLACLLLCMGVLLQNPVQTSAASNVLNKDQIAQTFAKAIKNGKESITFTTSNSVTPAQIQNILQDAAKTQNRMVSGGIRYAMRTGSDRTKVTYTFALPKDSFSKFTRIKSESAAKKAAVQALKNAKYSTNYYSDTSYYDIFRRILQQHPEYDYNTSVWRSTNGTYGYHRSTSLTKKQQDAKVKAADKAAAKAVKTCIKSGMSEEKKARAIHDYLLKKCSYDNQAVLAAGRYQDAFTAYGALVNGSAVCQGYAAAFNLMAQKCGLQSMAVCGTADGGPHAWNYVKIGNRYYYVDCTWDDTMTGETKISYTYFAVGANQMHERHVWNAAEFPAGDVKYSKYFQ